MKINWFLIILIILFAIGPVRGWFFCYYLPEAAKKDVLLCDYMPTPETRDMCYIDNKLLINDPEMCLKINRQMMRNWCYESVAERKSDPLLCDKIVEEEKNEIWGEWDSCRYAASNSGKCYSDEYCEAWERLDSGNRCCSISCDFEAVSKYDRDNWEQWWVQNCREAKCPPSHGCERYPDAKCVNNICQIK